MELHCAEIVIGSGTLKMAGNVCVFAFVAHADTSVKAQMLMGNDANTLLPAGAVHLAEC